MSHKQPAYRDTSVPFFVIPFIVASAFLMEAIDSNIITASIPAMALDFGIEPIRLNLAITCYFLSLGIFIPVSGWLAERVGARKVFISAMFVFTIGSLLCGMANSFETLIASRVIQGIGGALMTLVGRLILLRSFSREELVAAISYMTMPVLIGPLLGPLIGGYLTTYLNWRFIFLINIPIGLLGILAAWRYIPHLESMPVKRFDAKGFVYVALGLVLFQVALENFIHPFMPVVTSYAAVFVAILLGVIFYRHARKNAAPVLDISLFSIRPFRSGVIFGGLSRIGLNATPFLLQLKLQLGMGFSPIQAGGMVFIIAFGALSLKLLTKRILAAFGFKRLLVANALFGGALTIGFAWFDASTSLWLVGFHIFLFGFARSLQFNAINSLIYSEVERERQSGSVALAGAAQQITMGLGVSLAAIVINMAGGELVSLVAFDLSFMVMGCVPLLSAAGFLLLKSHDGAEASGYQKATRIS